MLESTNAFTIQHPITADVAVPSIDRPEKAPDLSDIITIDVVANEAVGY